MSFCFQYAYYQHHHFLVPMTQNFIFFMTPFCSSAWTLKEIVIVYTRIYLCIYIPTHFKLSLTSPEIFSWTLCCCKYDLQTSSFSITEAGSKFRISGLTLNLQSQICVLTRPPHTHTRWASLVARMVKNLSAMQETRVWSLGREDLMEKGMTTQSTILAWRIPWTDEPGRLQSLGSQRVGQDWATNTQLPGDLGACGSWEVLDCLTPSLLDSERSLWVKKASLPGWSAASSHSQAQNLHFFWWTTDFLLFRVYTGLSDYKAFSLHILSVVTANTSAIS